MFADSGSDGPIVIAVRKIAGDLHSSCFVLRRKRWRAGCDAGSANPGASLADVAVKLNWRYGKENKPYKQKVAVAVKVLSKDKLVHNTSTS
jgi:hypothetical protein